MDPNYLSRYKEFLAEYDRVMAKAAAGLEPQSTVSRFVCELSQFFCERNLELALAIRAYNTKREAISKTQDDNGKALAVDKIKFLAEATDEHFTMTINKIHVENIEKLIFSLYSLRKGNETEAKLGGNYSG